VHIAASPSPQDRRLRPSGSGAWSGARIPAGSGTDGCPAAGTSRNLPPARPADRRRVSRPDV